MSTVPGLAILGYILVGIFTAVYLHDSVKMKDSHCLLGGAFWPLVLYRAIRSGYLTDFWKELCEAFHND